MSRGRRLVAAGVCAAACVLSASTVRAQSADDRGRMEVSVGVMWTGAISLGTVAATEPSPSGPFTLFSTSTELAAAPGVEARIGVRLTPVLEVEASSSYGRPQLRTAITGDAENGAPTTASDTLQQYTIDGAAVINVTRWRIAGRATPFVLAGAGYMRQLHEGNTLVVPGQTYFAGGGIKYLLRARAHGLKGIGIRADARALMRRNGVAFDSSIRTSPVVAASLFVRF